MTEEQFNIELHSIKSEVADLFKATNKISYQMLLRKLSVITYKNAASEVGALFYFIIDSYDGEMSIYNRLVALFAPFRMPQKPKNQ